MQGHSLIRRIAWGLVLIALLASTPVLWNRYTRETGSRRVDLVLDLPAMQVLALQDGRPIKDLLVEAAQAGITSVAVPEMNAKDLADHGLARVVTGAQLRADLAMTNAPSPFLQRLVSSPDFNPGYTYVLPATQEVAQRLWRDVQLRFDPERVALISPAGGEPGFGAIALNYRDSQLAGYGIGYDPRDFEVVRQAGLRPVVRPRPAPGVTPESIKAIFADLDALAPEIRSVMFQGSEVLGWRPDRTDALQQTADELNQRGWVVDLVEHFSQLSFVDLTGYQFLAQELDYRVARVFSMGQEWQDKVLPYEAVDMWWRAVLERNSRALYLRPFLKKQDPGLSASETTMKYFAKSVEELQYRGYSTGVPDVFTPFYVTWWVRALLGFGVVGAVILWLSLIWPVDRRLLAGLMGIGLVGVTGMAYVMPNTGADIIALAVAVIFPTLAAAWLMVRWGVGWVTASIKPQVAPPSSGQTGWLVKEALIAAVAFFGINLVGGILVAATLGDITHILEFVYFRGVKLAFLAPLALTALTYLVIGRQGNPLVVLRSLVADGLALLKVTVKYRELLLLGLLGLAGLYYIQRSGNFPTVPISQLELDMRAALERLLLARPRTKEFLIAYPALVVSVAFLVAKLRQWVPLLILAAVTGGVSIINSFEHLRTQWALSLLRGINGLWLGLVIGAVALVGLIVLRWLVRRLFPSEGTPGSAR